MIPWADALWTNHSSQGEQKENQLPPFSFLTLQAIILKYTLTPHISHFSGRIKCISVHLKTKQSKNQKLARI